MSLPVQTVATLRLLIVDDDEIDRGQVRRLLHKAAPSADLRFDEAASGSQACESARTTGYDCILLDYILPGMSAHELLPALGTLQPDAAVVVLTGQGDENIAVELMKAGAADYLAKDNLDPGRLWNAVRYAVALAKVRRDTAHFEQERRRRAALLRSLVEAAPSISRALSLEELARVAAERTREVFGVDESFVWLRDRDSEATSVASASERAGLDARAWVQATAAAHGSQRPVRVLAEGTRRAALALGLFARDGSFVGCIAAHAPADPHELEGCEQALVQLAQIVSVTLENGRLFRETQAAVRVRDEVLAIVSHDLRTPLSNIRLGVALLRQHTQDEQAVLFERIERNVHHMTHLVDDLVDLARIEGSKLDVNPHGEAASDIVQAAIALVHPMADAAQVELVGSSGSAGPRVRADRHRTLQVLTNLLGNAIKFTPRGGVVRVTLEDRGQDVCFHVNDSGCGISEVDAPHVFRRFFRAPSAREGGLGLGLYIAKAVIDAHGGHIWFTSNPGRGTTFSFTLPREPAHRASGTLLESAGQ